MKQADAVRRVVDRRAQHAADKHDGRPRTQMRVGSDRVADTQVIHIHRLPADGSATQLQDSAGLLLNLPGYSQAGGPDIGS